MNSTNYGNPNIGNLTNNKQNTKINNNKYEILKKIINRVINENNKSTLHKILDILGKNSSNEEKQRLLSYKNKNKSDLKKIFNKLSNQKLEEIIFNSILYKEVKKNIILNQKNNKIPNKPINIPPIKNSSILKTVNNQKIVNQKIMNQNKIVNKKNNQSQNTPKNIPKNTPKTFLTSMFNFFTKPFRSSSKNQKS